MLLLVPMPGIDQGSYKRPEKNQSQKKIIRKGHAKKIITEELLKRKIVIQTASLQTHTLI